MNVYEQMQQNPLYANPETEIGAQEQMHALNLLDEQVRKIEFYVGVLTIPARVNDWLQRPDPVTIFPSTLFSKTRCPKQKTAPGY